MSYMVYDNEIGNTNHVMVVDDDEKLGQLLQRYLRQQGFMVHLAASAEEAFAVFSWLRFDLIIMDIMLPGQNGLEATACLRKYIDTPILLLTARGETADRIAGLEAGADDYLSKPFEPKELLLRMQAILRRWQPAKQKATDYPIKFGEWQFFAEKGELVHQVKGAKELTETEISILRLLLKEPGETITRESLVESSGGSISIRSVDVQINRLRRKIEDDSRFPRFIQTARGSGYIFRV
ncbi:MAG: response regulator [Alphaproteobacteria bacterium]